MPHFQPGFTKENKDARGQKWMAAPKWTTYKCAKLRYEVWKDREIFWWKIWCKMLVGTIWWDLCTNHCFYGIIIDTRRLNFCNNSDQFEGLGFLEYFLGVMKLVTNATELGWLGGCIYMRPWLPPATWLILTSQGSILLLLQHQLEKELLCWEFTSRILLFG